MPASTAAAIERSPTVTNTASQISPAKVAYDDGSGRPGVQRQQPAAEAGDEGGDGRHQQLHRQAR